MIPETAETMIAEQKASDEEIVSIDAVSPVKIVDKDQLSAQKENITDTAITNLKVQEEKTAVISKVQVEKVVLTSNQIITEKKGYR